MTVIYIVCKTCQSRTVVRLKACKAPTILQGESFRHIASSPVYTNHLENN